MVAITRELPDNALGGTGSSAVFYYKIGGKSMGKRELFIALAFVVAGAVMAFRRRRPFEAFLAVWAAVGFVLLLGTGGQNPIWLATVVVPPRGRGR